VSASLARLCLWLFVINLGVAFGAGLYEGRIVLSQWLSSAGDSGLHRNVEAAQRDNTGLRFWIFVTTVPLTLHTLTVATAMRWANLNDVRHGIVLMAWLAALKAFSLLYQYRG
jgi:hypothetical protein